MRTARAPIAARIPSLDVPDRVFIMPSGLAEQSPIYKHKVSDRLAAASDGSLKFAAIETKSDFPDCFPSRGNLELLDVDLVVGRGRDASSPLLHLATRFCDEGVAGTWTWSPALLLCMNRNPRR